MFSMIPPDHLEFPDLVLQAVAKTLKGIDRAHPIPMHEPSISNIELDFVSDCIKSNYVSSIGKYVDKFENELCEYTGSKRAIAVVNGTSALHISLLLSGVKQDDEVLLPSLTFVATANAVCYLGAVPHFIDSEENNLGVCPNSLADYLAKVCEYRDGISYNKNTGRKISAIIPVHVFGHPCKIDEIIEVAESFNLVVVEDAAESLGSFYNQKHAGTFGKFGILSFNGNKIITTGGGGAILTNDDHLADRAKHLTTTAKVAHVWEYTHDAVGYNYRMPNLNASLGCAQLKNLSKFIDSKRQLYKSYLTNLSILDGLSLLAEPKGCSSNYWLQTILLSQPNRTLRDRILEALNTAGYTSRPAWTCLHKQEPFKECPSMEIKVASILESKIINLPSSSSMINGS